MCHISSVSTSAGIVAVTSSLMFMLMVTSWTTHGSTVAVGVGGVGHLRWGRLRMAMLGVTKVNVPPCTIGNLNANTLRDVTGNR